MADETFIIKVAQERCNGDVHVIEYPEDKYPPPPDARCLCGRFTFADAIEIAEAKVEGE